MIKINLLPNKKKPAKKITELQKQLVLGSLILALVGGGLFFYYDLLSGKIQTLTANKAAAQARINEQEQMLTEVKNVEAERKNVGDKIKLIEQLKKNQGILVRLLDEVSKALPKGVNLASLNERSGSISLDGMAFTNHDIVRFVENLKASNYCSEVFLMETVQTKQDGIDVYRYKLQFKLKEAI
jgi:type IV pilus assembly protein PilN